MKGLLFISFTCLMLVVNAQQNAMHNQYFMNQYFLNPANAGESGTRMFLDYRRQWAGITGAPESQLFTLDGALKNKKMGLGLTVSNDRNNIFGRVSAMGTYAYQLEISDVQNVRFGVSAGVSQNTLLFDNVHAEDPTEISIFSSNQTSAAFDASFGLQYSIGKGKIGFTMNNLLANSFKYDESFDQRSLVYRSIRKYTVTAGYDFILKNKNWMITPFALFRTVEGSAGQWDGNVKVEYKNLAWVNLAYRHQVGYAASIGGKINDKIYLGYTYELPSTELKTHSSGSHEVLVGYQFGKGGGNGGFDNATLKKMQQENAELLQKTDILEQENIANRKKIEEQQKLIEDFIDGLEEWKNSAKIDEDELKKFIEDNQVTINEISKNTKETLEGTSIKDVNEVEDLNVGYYVIVGANKSFEAAKDFQKIVAREYGYETKVMRNAKDSWYFIYTLNTSDKDAAVKEVLKVRKENTKDLYVGKPWVYRHEK